MKADSNKKTFIKALSVAKEKMHLALLRRLAEYGEILLEDAKFSGEYTSFTGNTLTSLAFGVYENNQLTDVVFISGVGAPVHAKIQEGQRKWLYFPYEGDARFVLGSVEIEDAWGDETSIKTLQALCPKGGNGIIVTTGTEYSTFLEQVKDLNVLSNTFLKAEQEGLYEMKRWLDVNKPIERL